MESLVLPVLAAAIMLGLYFRKKTHPVIQFTPPGLGLFWAALILQGLYAAFWLMFGLGEVTRSISGGAIHLIPAVSAILLIFTARRLPLEGGLVLAVEGLLLAVYTVISIEAGASKLPAILFAAAPAILSGLLLLGAVGLALAAPKPK